MEKASRNERESAAQDGKAKEDRKRLNEEINVLERKFKYASLKTSLGLSQDEQEKVQREVCLWKRQADKA